MRLEDGKKDEINVRHGASKCFDVDISLRDAY